MATSQEQIDDLKRQLANLQNDISLRAKRTDVNSINVDVSAEQIALNNTLIALQECVSEIMVDLIDAREELRTHTH